MNLEDIFSYGFIQKAFLGGIAIALSCGLIGPFLVLRKQSLLGDGLAHLAFGGIALGLLFEVDPLWSALISALIGSWIVQKLIRKFYGDAAIAIILSLGVGMGVIVISLAGGFNSSLYHYLIGSILTLTIHDLYTIYGVLGVNLIFLRLFYPDWFFLTFNEELAELKTSSRSDFFFTAAVAITVVISIRAVGILLVSSLLCIPTLIALGMARSFQETLLFSSLVGTGSVISGILIAYTADIPPSGAIVLVLLTLFISVSGLTKVLDNR